MVKRDIFCFCILFFLMPVVLAHDGYTRNLNVDILHYQFTLSLNDSTDRIDGNAVIIARFLNDADSLSLDLNGLNSDGKGMTVTKVSSDAENLSWTQRSEKLTVFFSDKVRQNDTVDFTVEYNGIPSDGLIISKNKFGNRTFFADHWPDRAHNYLPCIDHPSDKASVDFIITAPDRYKVVASGVLIEESDLVGDMTLTHWHEAVPLATKVMTFGAAQFAVQLAGTVNSIPVTSWVFSENRDNGFHDYSIAVKPLDYYSSIVGPYPYEKLANVQSKTIFGGLENAGTIFYFQNSVTGFGRAEGLIAHEIAHQWFGDCVTEADWHHIWLSEGFATYMTSLYFESKWGNDSLKSNMASTRRMIFKDYEKNPGPVIDTTITDLIDLLSVNSYQKGAWVLHMLRHELGDEDFFKGLRLYYKRFYNSNALTEDFKNVMEEVSGKDLDKFFYQWLFTPGQPELSISHNVGKEKGTIEVIVEQKQKNLFDFNLEISVKEKRGEKIKNIPVSERITKIVIPAGNEAVIIPDPGVNLLFRLIK